MAGVAGWGICEDDDRATGGVTSNQEPLLLLCQFKNAIFGSLVYVVFTLSLLFRTLALRILVTGLFSRTLRLRKTLTKEAKSFIFVVACDGKFRDDLRHKSFSLLRLRVKKCRSVEHEEGLVRR